MANCYACKAEIVFDNEHVGRNGKKIPLDPSTKQPHDCPMREKKPLGEKMSYGAFGGEEKDDHGNESYSPASVSLTDNSDLKFYGTKINPSEDKKYVDHTLKGQSKVMIFSNETKADTQAEYNEFLRVNNGKIKTQGAHDHVTKQDETEPLVYTIYLYYEEVK